MIDDPDDTTDFRISSHIVRVHQKHEEAVSSKSLELRKMMQPQVMKQVSYILMNQTNRMREKNEENEKKMRKMKFFFMKMKKKRKKKKEKEKKKKEKENKKMEKKEKKRRKENDDQALDGLDKDEAFAEPDGLKRDAPDVDPDDDIDMIQQYDIDHNEEDAAETG